MNKLEILIDAINQYPEVITFKKLESLVEDNEEYSKKLNDLFYYQKQIINAKHLEKENIVSDYETKYNALKQELVNDPLIDTYLSSLEEVNSLLDIITNIIYSEINNELNKKNTT